MTVQDALFDLPHVHRALPPLHPDRVHRVQQLVTKAHRLLDVAQAFLVDADGRETVATCILWSGGNDSNLLAHLMRSRATHVAMANTGVGVEATREHVRRRAAEWGLPLLERHGDPYEDYVLTHGFPGPAQHSRMYQRLKERALMQVRRELLAEAYPGEAQPGRRGRVLYLSGRRRTESKRREGHGDADRPASYKSAAFVMVLADWTLQDMTTYRAMHPDVPHNPVTDIMHMSGECLCGAYGDPGELALVRLVDPAVADYLEHDLPARARAAGVPAQRCVWGWGREGRQRDARMACDCP